MYDIYMASTNTITPLRYEVNYRNYLLVTQGSIRVMLIPPKDTRYLYPITDYDIFEFRSPVNPWKVQAKYQDDFDKIKTLEVDLYQGMAMFIPAYWWYSIKFTGSETSVCSFKYRTYMSTLSIAPQIVMSALQHMNTKRDTLEKRVIGKQEFQRKTSTPSTNIKTQTTTNSSSHATAPAPTEYTPSIEQQYLPKSLRGTNNNPYSIMNAMTESVNNKDAMNVPNVPKPDNAHVPSTVAAAAAVALASATSPVTTTPVATSTVSADPSISSTSPPESVTLLASVPVAEYTSTQKEVTIPSSTTVTTINL
jgi:hypothetical protein